MTNGLRMAVVSFQMFNVQAMSIRTGTTAAASAFTTLSAAVPATGILAGNPQSADDDCKGGAYELLGIARGHKGIDGRLRSVRDIVSDGIHNHYSNRADIHDSHSDDRHYDDDHGPDDKHAI